ncbi:Baculoviral IAP repeat-containing protein 7 [Orchesella cincta]|uniref:Baculoviral IAP repeat-containing protein 7 n=1 Tax=Orchesella cincta TaxID=48709 RepID=A0A1D2M586_ORCCI|nr:Baculoviral IAP repeat-containing protein 7 [Orchesella cincta]
MALSAVIQSSSNIFKPEMGTLSSRLKSFEKWEHKNKPEPSVLAEAGFFFSGKQDRVYCFYCGIGLHHWLSEDNPWMEHAISSPKCTFLLVNRARSNMKHLDTSPLSELYVS